MSDFKRILILLVIFILAGIGLRYYSDYTYEVKGYDTLMKNNFHFEGIITKIQVSNNHAFGILQLKVTKSNINEYRPKLEDALFPYVIKDSIAEVYTGIYVGYKIGDKVIVDSNKIAIEFFEGNTRIDKGDIFITTETADIDYVKKHTVFKEEK